MSPRFSPSNLGELSDDELQKYGLNQYNWSQFEYRVELSRRFALAFDADHLIVFDDVAMVTGESERLLSLSAIQGCDRSLLPTLWLSIGFEYGGTIIVYAPPNPIEMREFISIRNQIEGKVQRRIKIRILFNGFNDILALYEKSSNEYTELCLKYATTPTTRPVFISEYHVEQLKKYANDILNSIQNKQRTLIFPFEVTPYHVQELSNDKRFILPDLPTNDKAKHNFVLRQAGFTKLPQLLMVCVDGSVLDSYEEYKKTISSLTSITTENTPINAERFARSVVVAIDRLYAEYGFHAFVKLDAAGAGGWSCMCPDQHLPLYDHTLTQNERIAYVNNYIQMNVIDEHLPTHAVVEEFVEAELRPGNILADYTVCGLLINGKFFPTSINLCGTDAGQYVEQWTASDAELLNDSNTDWQAMFETYLQMSEYESKKLNYLNGVYAGDLFISKEKREHKQRDWNIRRGGRSTPETLTMFDKYNVNYECKVILQLNTILNSIRLTNEQLFNLYTNICDELANGLYQMYPFSTGYAYFGQADDGNFLKFNFVINPSLLIDNQQNVLPKDRHREQVYDIIKQTIAHHINLIVNLEQK